MDPSLQNYEENLHKAERIAYLIAGHLRGTLSEEEAKELEDWISESDENLELFEKLTDEEHIESAMAQYKGIESGKAAAWKGVQEKIRKDGGKLRIWPYLVVAGFVLIVTSVFLLLPKYKPSYERPFSHVGVKQELPAGTDRAVLTLSDGRTVILDSSNKGLLASDGGIAINQNHTGQVEYTGTDTAMRYNTISTPRGGQYKLVLGDGTAVWLNADSYLKFPAGFNGKQRAVELKGEAYFEVAKDREHPFVVNVVTPNGSGGTIEVLGTHFNVNAYGDEEGTETTLLEGLVRITANGDTKLLRPGEQAISPTAGGGGVIIRPSDTLLALAWKEGKFIFRNATIQTIGRQLSRWYDVEVEYRGQVSQHFNTEADRRLPLPKLLAALQGTAQISFKLEGRKLVIQPATVSR
jgi:ferric-dicitrate binding protein FerR (iron transport regulator)